MILSYIPFSGSTRDCLTTAILFRILKLRPLTDFSFQSFQLVLVDIRCFGRYLYGHGLQLVIPDKLTLVPSEHKLFAKGDAHYRHWKEECQGAN